LIDQLQGAGMHPGDVYQRVFEHNRGLDSPLEGVDVLSLLLAGRGGSGAAPAAGPHPQSGHARSVYQEYQEKQDNHRATPSVTESHRAGAAPAGEISGAAQPEHVVPLDLAFAEYVARAADAHNGRAGDDPEWHSPLFGIVRLLKAHPQVTGATPREAFREVDRVVRSWAGGRGQDPWERWFLVGREDAEAEFLGAWDKVRYLPGYSPLRCALGHARIAPLRLKEEVARERPAGYPLFVSLAGWLRVGMGDRNILLPVEEVAELLHVRPVTVSRYRRWAKADGYLKEVRPHTFRGKGKGGAATEFRFNVAWFPCLRKRAQDGTGQSFEGAAGN
jgi:hypothetical protein